MRRLVFISMAAFIAASLTFAGSASAGTHHANRSYPHLFDNLGIQLTPMTNITFANDGSETVGFTVTARYSQNAARYYPAIKHDHGIIPAVWMQLTLFDEQQQAAVALLSDSFHESRFYEDGSARPLPLASQRWSTSGDLPTWKCLQAAPTVTCRMSIWLSGLPGAWFKVKVMGMARVHGHWVRIGHAPVEHLKATMPLVSVGDPPMPG